MLTSPLSPALRPAVRPSKAKASVNLLLLSILTEEGLPLLTEEGAAVQTEPN